jgi:hypothetical protein
VDSVSILPQPLENPQKPKKKISKNFRPGPSDPGDVAGWRGDDGDGLRRAIRLRVSRAHSRGPSERSKGEGASAVTILLALARNPLKSHRHHENGNLREFS